MAQDDSQLGMLTDLHLWCPMGLTRAEVDVLLRIRKLSWGKGRFPVNPVLIAMSSEPPAEVPLAVGTDVSKPMTSRVWHSATPFIPPGHFFRGDKSKPKAKANATPELQLAKALSEAGLTTPVLIQRMSAFQHSSSPKTAMDEEVPMPAWDIVLAPEGDDLSA